MAEDPFAKLVQDWQDANPAVRPKTKTTTSATTILSQNPRTAISVAGGAMAINKGYDAWQNVYREVGKTMKASGKTEAQVVKELTKMGYDAKAVTPKVGSAEFKALAREASANAKLGWLPWGKQYQNLAETTQLPKIQLTGYRPVNSSGIGVLKPAQVTPPLSAEKVLELAKAGTISPEGALNTTAKFALNEALPPQGVSKWIKAGQAYKGMMGGDVAINNVKNLRSGYKGARLAGASGALELAGAGIDVFGSDGLYMSQYNKDMLGSDYTGKQSLAVASALARSGMRLGRGAGEALTYGGLGMSGLPDWEERRDAINNAHRIFRDEKAKITGDSSTSYPVELTHTGLFSDNHNLRQNENEKGNELFKAIESSPRFKAIYSKELARLGVPQSVWTPDVYKGPEHEYSIDSNDKINARPFGSALARQELQYAYEDASVEKYNRSRSMLNVDPNMGALGWTTPRGTDQTDLGLYSTDGFIR